MKIRNGFISNSSSSSFILQTSLSKEELMQELIKIITKLHDFNSKYNRDYRYVDEKYKKGYTPKNIVKNVEILTIADKDDNEFVFEWWKSIDLSDKHIIYISENYLYDADQFWQCLMMLDKTELINYSGHMG